MCYFVSFNMIIDVHVIQYTPSSNVLYCYATNTTSSASISSIVDLSSSNNSTNTGNTGVTVPIDVPITPITSIDIYDNNGTLVNVKNLSEPITISSVIPSAISTLLSFGSTKCSTTPQPICSWFDHTTNQWSTSGCTTVSVTSSTDGSGSSTVQCSCNHLTEFAVLARESMCGITYADEEKVYSAFTILYLIIMIASLVQLSRVIIYTGKKCKLDLLAAEHVCVFIIALFRAVVLFIRSDLSWSGVKLTDMSLVAIGLLTAIPYLFQFIAYTFLVATWASVYHFAMEKRGSSPFDKLRTPFIIVNTIIGIIVFGLFGAIGGTNDADVANKLSMTGTIIMAILTLVMVIVYLVYGRALINTLTKTGGKAAAESPVVRRLYFATAAFCTCFAIESILWIISAIILDNVYQDAAGLLGAYYGVNWCSLVIIIALFRQGICPTRLFFALRV
jgi:hypothetical protein